jgi:trehalose 6-phosphate phosphatase
MSAMEKHVKLFESERVHILHGKSVIEARPLGVDKGTAVALLAKQKPFLGRAILFGGDDTTDLDVFRILPQLGGSGFSVGQQFPGAEYTFESPLAVRRWLTGASAEAQLR